MANLFSITSTPHSSASAPSDPIQAPGVTVAGLGAPSIERDTHDPESGSSCPTSAQWGKPLLLHGKNWFMVRGGQEVSAFKAELNQIVEAGRGFIKQNAAAGGGMESALKGLDAFERSKVNCAFPLRAMVTFGVNRQNLARFVSLLNEDSIPMSVRCAAAVELFGSLGTCPEGEALRIEEQTAKLGNFGKGLSTRYSETKEQLIDQALGQLVRQEYSWQTNFDQLEIHHVNALKNMHASEWGLQYREDRYSRTMVQDQCGGMAKALVDATVTPNKVSAVLSEQIRDVCMANLGVPDCFSEDGRPTFTYRQSQIDLLDAGLKAEFGDNINLNDLLEFSDDYSAVSLKGTKDIQALVLGKMQKEGVLKTDVPVSRLTEDETVQVADALRHINKQFAAAGTVSPARKYSQSVTEISLYAISSIGQNSLDTRRRDEEEKLRLRGGHGVGAAGLGGVHHHGQQSPALGLGQGSSTPENKSPGG